MKQDLSPAEGSAPQVSDKAMISAMLGAANIFFLCLLVAGYFACAVEFVNDSVCIDDSNTLTRFFLLSLLLSAIGVVTGRSAKLEIEKSNGTLEGSRAAQVGIVLGRLGLIILGLTLVALACLALYALGSI